MSLFKVKSNKSHTIDTRVNVQSKHNDFMSFLNNKSKEMPENFKKV